MASFVAVVVNLGGLGLGKLLAGVLADHSSSPLRLSFLVDLGLLVPALREKLSFGAEDENAGAITGTRGWRSGRNVRFLSGATWPSRVGTDNVSAAFAYTRLRAEDSSARRTGTRTAVPEGRRVE